jgi:hypothetical protein
MSSSNVNTAVNTSLRHPAKDPSYVDLYVDGEFLGFFHRTDRESGVQQFVEKMWGGEKKLLRIDGRELHFGGAA